jgi:hypothetical protein
VIIVIGRRVHASDVPGVIFDLNLDYDALMIPMRYDTSRQVLPNGEPWKTKIGWFDPRYDPDLDKCDGVLAWPERFPEHVVERIRAEGGPIYVPCTVPAESIPARRWRAEEIMVEFV